MTFERRQTGGELRAEGRRLSGTVMRFGDVSPSHRERFDPGSLRMAAAVPLNLFHDPERAVAWRPGGGLDLESADDALRMVATLPPITAADRALAEVRAGTATGLSVEFQAERERREGGLRVVEAATLTGIGLVRAPSYEGSRVEARARRGSIRGVIPTGKRLECRCHRGSGSCQTVQFARGAFDGALADDELILFSKDYGGPIGSVKRGSLRVREGKAGIEIDADIPDTTAGRDLIAASQNVPLIVRPLFDPDGSSFTESGDLATYSAVGVRALLIGATDASEGWPEAKITGARREAGSGRVWL